MKLRLVGGCKVSLIVLGVCLIYDKWVLNIKWFFFNKVMVWYVILLKVGKKYKVVKFMIMCLVF